MQLMNWKSKWSTETWQQIPSVFSWCLDFVKSHCIAKYFPHGPWRSPVVLGSLQRTMSEWNGSPWMLTRASGFPKYRQIKKGRRNPGKSYNKSVFSWTVFGGSFSKGWTQTRVERRRPATHVRLNNLYYHSPILYFWSWESSKQNIAIAKRCRNNIANHLLDDSSTSVIDKDLPESIRRSQYFASIYSEIS